MTDDGVLDLREVCGDDCDIKVLSLHNPQMAVFSFPKHVSDAQREHIREMWSRVTDGTKLAGLKAVILDGGVTFSIVDYTEEAAQ